MGAEFLDQSFWWRVPGIEFQVQSVSAKLVQSSGCRVGEDLDQKSWCRVSGA